MSSEGCPCRFTTACHPRCTCVHAASSTGCRRCCGYGSLAQRRAAAEDLARRIDAPTPLDARLVAVVRATLFAEDYAKAEERCARQNAPDDLTAKDVADGYREGYQELHKLVSKLWAKVEELPHALLSAARGGRK